MAEDQELWLLPTTWDDDAEHRRRIADLTNRLAAAHALPTRYARLAQPAGVMAIVVPTGLQAPTRNAASPWIGFDITLTYGMAISFTLPPDYEEGEPITPALRWAKDSVVSLTGSVMWWSRHRIFPVGVTATAFTASVTGSGRASVTSVALAINEVVFPNITSLSGMGAGTVIEVQFGRLNLSGGDTYSSSAMVAGFDLIYPQNARGHDDPFTKYIDTSS